MEKAKKLSLQIMKENSTDDALTTTFQVKTTAGEEYGLGSVSQYIEKDNKVLPDNAFRFT